MDREPASLLRQGVDNRTSTWWGPTTDPAAYVAGAASGGRLAGPGRRRILDLGAGPGGNAAARAQTLRCYSPAAS